MDDHKVAANEDGPRDGRQVQLVFFPNADAVWRWAAWAERMDLVDDLPNRERIGLSSKQLAYGTLVQNVPLIRLVQ